LISEVFDRKLESAKVARILAIGDCHAGRTFSHLSGFVRSRFYGGSIYSWVNGSRSIPPLKDLIGMSLSMLHGKRLVIIFSYGEIDVRCHSPKWRGKSAELALAYVRQVYSYLSEFMEHSTTKCFEILAILLAIPPPTDKKKHNPKAPCVGSLQERVKATEALNGAIRSCQMLAVDFTDRTSFKGLEPEKSNIVVRFSGVDTWSFARLSQASSNHQSTIPDGSILCGSLNPRISDGVHVRAEECGPLHARIREIMEQQFAL